jgi:hypothetical protein
VPVVNEYPLPGLLDGRSTIELPEGAVLRHFTVLWSGNLADPEHHPTLWAEVDPDKPVESRSFMLVQTGQPFDGAGAYIATYDRWHIYEAPPPEWTEWPGGDGPPESTFGKVVDITEAGSNFIWTGPAAAADWTGPCRYRFAAEQPELL